MLAFLKNEKCAGQWISEEEAVKIVVMIMEHFHDYCKCLYKEKIHKKCNDSLKKNLPCLKIENEYDVQRLMYPVIRSIFADARLEETQDSGHHMVRKDIVIDSQDIVVELKCSGKAVTERRISEEIAADIVHYGNKHILFYIYDKEDVIKNAVDFQKSYESKQIGNKQMLFGYGSLMRFDFIFLKQVQMVSGSSMISSGALLNSCGWYSITRNI